MAKITISFKALLAGAVLACAFLQTATAAEVSGVKFDETAKVAGKELKLNGLGIRTKFIVKVYAAGLYLPEKKNTVADIMKVEGPRRLTLVMMREISSDDFGQSFMTGLNNNIDKAEKTRYVSQISKFGEMFATIEGLKKGDVLHIDWIPGTGTQCELNGKKIGEAQPDVNYYNAVLKIWLGDKPADSSLKPLLLGDAR
jgi:hypothetical protein